MAQVRLAVDTTVPIYALGVPSPQRAACRGLIDAVAAERVRLEASIGIVQEVAHVRSHRTGDRDDAARQAQRLLTLLECHPVERPDMERALGLFAAHRRLDMLDALHAATALNHGHDRIVTADRAFDDVAQLQRIEPVDALALLEEDA
ncbi:MAG: type II toxin-antitoxin system VapC family toxin [Actinobacteria bacterium]|nr:type II toxin-antitoxin system VapC family toxin [Actinomycetota bacterium]